MRISITRAGLLCQTSKRQIYNAIRRGIVPTYPSGNPRWPVVLDTDDLKRAGLLAPEWQEGSMPARPPTTNERLEAIAGLLQDISTRQYQLSQQQEALATRMGDLAELLRRALPEDGLRPDQHAAAPKKRPT